MNNGKLSQLTEDEIRKLPDSVIEKLVFTADVNIPHRCRYGIVPGGKPFACIPRALRAAELYRDGVIEKVIVSGGARWFVHGVRKPEYRLLRKVLLENGVPGNAVICEKKARTTGENMTLSCRLIEKDLRESTEKSVVIITSHSHLKRALALAEKLLPRDFEIFGAYCTSGGDAPGRWQNDGVYRERVIREVLLYGDLIKEGVMSEEETV